MLSAAQVYKDNIAKFEGEIEVLKRKRSNVGWIRLLIVIITAAIIKFSWQQQRWVLFAETIAGMAAFLYAVSIDTDMKEKLQNAEKLRQINKDEIDVLNNNFLNREDGQQFNAANHPYANDLDVFGTASLFQYISRCTAEQSKELLASQLLGPSPKSSILLKQAAIKELSNKTAWRQQMQAYGLQSPVTNATERKLKNWLALPTIFTAGYWHWLARIYPVITLGAGLLYAVDVIAAPVFYLLVFCFLIFAFSLSKKIHHVWILLSKIVEEADTIYRQLAFIESEDFNAEYITAVKMKLQSAKGLPSSSEIKELKNILNRFDVRLNTFAFILLNTFLLWDLWQLLYLNKWKDKNAANLSQWFNAIAEMEALSSIATLAFNQPTWCYPAISDEHFTLQAANIGHPLIPAAKRVNNSFNLQGVGKVSIITGSNMGGKSTFLRSVGVNVVLAMMGSPVCAESFTISVISLMSSMRIADNLAESTSTFYAELKKLKTIIDAVNNKERIFILLDEILRGTNSLDRHTGSGALIKQLIKQHAVAVVATHDVELAKLQDSYPNNISNYHFDVQVENDELFFDYKLKPGICTSLNASILMRKIGIELEQ